MSVNLLTQHSLTVEGCAFKWCIPPSMIKNVQGVDYITIYPSDCYFARLVYGSPDKTKLRHSLANHPGMKKLLELRNEKQVQDLLDEPSALRDDVASSAALSNMFGTPTKGKRLHVSRKEYKEKRAELTSILLDLGRGQTLRCIRPVLKADPLEVPLDQASLSTVLDFIRSYGSAEENFKPNRAYVKSGKYKRKASSSDAEEDAEEAASDAVPHTSDE